MENLKMTRLRWTWGRLEALAALDVFDALHLRQDIFVLEQRCLYPDIDTLDRSAWHLLGRNAPGELTAYLRVVPPGGRYREPSIGRVVTRAQARGGGLGRVLMSEGIQRTEDMYSGLAIRISAQAHLQRFYGSLGFFTQGEEYLEDDIPHVEMLRFDV
jgi:ElaA protein